MRFQACDADTPFPTRDLERFFKYLSAEWARLLIEVKGDEREALLDAVGEIFENVFSHANSPVGAVVAGQHFSHPHSQRPPELHLAIVDIGDTIPLRVAERAEIDPDLVDPAKALAFAFRPQVSSEGSRRGSGMAIFRRFIEKNDAEVELYSGLGWARIGKNSRIVKGSAKVPGTAYDIIIRGIDWVPRPEELW